MPPKHKKDFKPQNATIIPAAKWQALYGQGLALHQEGQLTEAQVLFEQVLKFQPKHFDALHLLGVIAVQVNNPEKAVELIGKALEINQQDPAAFYNLGCALQELKRFQAALEGYGKAIALKPDFVAAYYNCGVIFNITNQYQASIENFDMAITLKPDYVQAYNNRADPLKSLGQYQAAIESYDKAIALRPDYATAYYNRGITLSELKRYKAALEDFDKAIALKPGYAEAHNNRASVLKLLGQYQAALESYDKAIDLKPDYADAYFNRGMIPSELKHHNAAIDDYDKAIALKPDHIEAYNNRANALKSLRQHQAALESYGKAIALKPDYAEAYHNRGITLSELKRYKAAIEDYDKALALKPDYEFLYGTRLYNKLIICDWTEFEDQSKQLEKKISNGKKASTPFPALINTSSLPVQQKAAEIYASHVSPRHHSVTELCKYPRHAKIRIGYFSADFHNHPVSLLTAELFESHDKSKFELTAFSFGPHTTDEIRLRVSKAFDSFLDVQNQSDEQVVQLARQMELDIAVDLGGYTGNSRPGIFAMRAAPIQVSYIGYLGTMGADFIDYLIADPVIIPESARQFYNEKIAYLPSYQVNDSKRRIADITFTRKELGLPDGGFVFCCFNNTYKITPNTFDSWMRILKAVAGSVLFLYAENDQASINLKKEAELRGVSAERLIFGKRLPVPEYLARYRSADLFLDTLPYNAGTTASDALWAGLPLLTCTGEAFASRVAASLLSAIGLPELITVNSVDYESLAIELAKNPIKLKAIKEKLALNRHTTPLFDTPRFTRSIEAAYRTMYGRFQADMPVETYHRAG